jgi:hypothetical protein
MSRRILDIDVNLLDNSTLGLFIEDSGEAQESQELVRNLAHAAMQNQTIELSDVLAVVKQKGTQEAEEALKAAEKARHEREDTNAQKQREFDSEQADKAREHEKEVWANEKDNIILKEEERRKTVVQAQAMMSMGFNENKDVDNDGQLDIIEVMKNANAVQIQMEKTQLENRKLDHTIENDKEKNSIERSKINMNNNLPKKTSPKK